MKSQTKGQARKQIYFICINDVEINDLKASTDKIWQQHLTEDNKKKKKKKQMQKIKPSGNVTQKQ